MLSKTRTAMDLTEFLPPLSSANSSQGVQRSSTLEMQHFRRKVSQNLTYTTTRIIYLCIFFTIRYIHYM